MARGVGPVFTRSEMGYSFNYQYLNTTDPERRQPRGETGNYPFYHHYPTTDMEKRQLFLRSYQFSRKKKSVGERIRGSFFRVKRVIWVRLRYARRIRWMVWSRIKLALLCCARKRRFLRLHSQNNNNKNDSRIWSSSCFW
ncbi:hypothetical protein RHMOL_Rhmol11G0172300 [Rhododendron molle]|uniref:Uncharacterized protein n=1 Tax=Rhododendron molle TaxID=49168 RepID=A0ACC0LTB2_RHOML|nr:hypothetical protein RHMOL_Rhmol11G0172300 [Rhododendron molle]